MDIRFLFSLVGKPQAPERLLMEPGCVICIPVFQSISCFPGCASVADASRKTPEAIATSGLPGFSKSQVTAGFEPAIRELQSHALPLGYVTTLKPCGAVKNCPTDARIRSADFSPTHRAQPLNEESLCDSECSTANYFECTAMVHLIKPERFPKDSLSDPDGNRTRVTAVKGRCLNRLTTGPRNASSRARTCNTSVNSRVLYH